MTTAAQASYLTALLDESQQREKGYKANLAAADTRHDRGSAASRLEQEQGRQDELRTELAALPA